MKRRISLNPRLSWWRSWTHSSTRSQSLRRDGQEPCILAEGNRHTEHERHVGSSHDKEDLKVKSLQRSDQFFLKLGTLTTVEDAYNIADTKYSVSPVAKIAVRPKDGKDRTKLIDLPRKTQICI